MPENPPLRRAGEVTSVGENVQEVLQLVVDIIYPVTKRGVMAARQDRDEFIVRRGVIWERGTVRVYCIRPWDVSSTLRMEATYRQITRFGKWDVMPFSLALTINSQVSYFDLSLRHNLPQGNTAKITASSFEWHGTFPSPPSQPAAIVFGVNCLALVVNDIHYATFPYPEYGSNTVLKSNMYSLAPTFGAHFFRRPSRGVGHKAPLKPTMDATSDIGLPPTFLEWPRTSPASIIPGEARLCPLLSPACVNEPTLPPAAWLAAYSALNISEFQQSHLNALTTSSILEEFTDEIAPPILQNDLDSIW